jgi:hypothetical protein
MSTQGFNPFADPIEHGKARGVVVTRSPDSNLYIEHTPPAAPPPAPPDASARAQVALLVSSAEEMVKECGAAHKAATEKVALAQQALLQAPDQPWPRQKFLDEHTLLVVAANHLDAAKAHRDHVVAQIAAAEASGDLDLYDAKNNAQWDLPRVLAPLEKRAFNTGCDLGGIAKDTYRGIGEIMTARREASRLATKLGIKQHRDSGIDIGAAARKIAKAFTDGFRSAGQRTDRLREWVEG